MKSNENMCSIIIIIAVIICNNVKEICNVMT
jgi:hypothetical protein